MASDAYQRAPGATKLLASRPSRLRSDQLYESITAALGVGDLYFDLTPKRGPLANLRGPRNVLAEEYGFDPSEPRDEQAGSIPQALLLMNSKAVQRAIDGDDPRTALAKLLDKTKDNTEVIEQLYLRSLARHPTEKELETCLNHVKKTGDRTEAFEDVLWALINSTEMLNRK
jgi:hypothetical protein